MNAKAATFGESANMETEEIKNGRVILKAQGAPGGASFAHP